MIYDDLPLHIAVIAAHPQDVRLIEQACDDLRFHVRVSQAGNAVDGERLIETLIAQNDGPDLILVDLNLPGRCGHELVRSLRAQRLCSITPIVIMTSLALPGDRERSADCGANAFVVKPSSYDDLLPLLAHIISQQCPFQLAQRDLLC